MSSTKGNEYVKKSTFWYHSRYFQSTDCQRIRSGSDGYHQGSFCRQQQESISRIYRETAALNKATVVPAGEVWAEARALRPDFKLYFPDDSHPSELGTYLTACVFVATIIGELPATIPGVISVTDNHGEEVILMMLDQLDVDFCRNVAVKTVGNIVSAGIR